MWILPEKQAFVLKKLSKNGYEAYLVGGCVRDYLMGKTPHDYDITSAATPKVVEKLFEKTVPTGITHGTVTVIIDGEPIEVTTFRTEGEYKDSRHPERVDFVTDIKEDLSRRDFTVNAIAYNEKAGFVDPFGGIKDIKSKTLKAVGDPIKRFNEDALRILRLFRFAATLEFSIEQETLTAAISTAKGLKNISIERVTGELLKTLTGTKVQMLSPLIGSGGLKAFGLYKTENAEKISLLKKSLPLRLFSLYKNCGSGLKGLKNLRLSNEIRFKTTALFELEKSEVPKTKPEIKRLLRDHSIDAVTDFLNYKNVFCGCDITSANTLLDEVLKAKEPFKISDLKISGKDVLSLDVKDYKVGQVLDELLEKVIEDPTLNTKQNLIDLIRN